MWISANDERIRYTGRIDWSVEGEPVWVFPGSSAEFWFSGEVLRIHVENFLNSLRCENVGRKSYIQFSELK